MVAAAGGAGFCDGVWTGVGGKNNPAEMTRAASKLGIETVSVGRRLADDEEPYILLPAVEGLMRETWRDFKSLVGAEPMLGSIEFQCKLAGEDIEKLPRRPMKMAALGGSRRHALFNHRERVGAYQVPAIAVVAPLIVRRGFSRNHLCLRNH